MLSLTKRVAAAFSQKFTAHSDLIGRSCNLSQCSKNCITKLCNRDVERRVSFIPASFSNICAPRHSAFASTCTSRLSQPRQRIERKDPEKHLCLMQTCKLAAGACESGRCTLIALGNREKDFAPRRVSAKAIFIRTLSPRYQL